MKLKSDDLQFDKNTVLKIACGFGAGRAPHARYARGDSISVEQIGLLQEIIKRNQNNVIDHFKTDAVFSLMAF